MFASNSRYYGLATYTVTSPGGGVTNAVRLPAPPVSLAIAGYHVRRGGDRLDNLAAKYLNDPTLFWKLCDTNGVSSAPALENRPLIGIPASGQ
jgi:hypothetical protein